MSIFSSSRPRSLPGCPHFPPTLSLTPPPPSWHATSRSRQYGHRVKGISMSKFSKEEIESLQAGGNAVFFSTHCSTWSPSSLPRPTDRNPDKTKAWIEAVYVNKRYISDDSSSAKGGAHVDDATATATATTTTTTTIATQHSTSAPVPSTDNEDADVSSVTVLNLSDLGGTVPKLEIGGGGLKKKEDENSGSSTSSSARVATKSLSSGPMPFLRPPPGMNVPVLPAATAAPPPPPQQSSPPPPPPPPPTVPLPPSEPWDPFAVVEEPSLPPPSGSDLRPNGHHHPPHPTALPVENKHQQQHDTSASTTTKEGFMAEWNAFAEDVGGNVGQETAPSHQRAQPQPQVQQQTQWTTSFQGGGNKDEHPTPSPPTISALPGSNGHGHGHVGGSAPLPPPPPPPVVAAAARKEISMDAFYPEFEKIRATGMLPTGQSVVEARMTQLGVSPYQSQNSMQRQQQQLHSPYGTGAPSPYGVVPNSPYPGVSNDQQYDQQQYYYHTAPTPSPPPLAYQQPPSPYYHQQQLQQQQYTPPPVAFPAAAAPAPPPFGHFSAKPPSPLKNTEAMNGTKFVEDPFAHFAPALKGALPSRSPPPPPPSVTTITTAIPFSSPSPSLPLPPQQQHAQADAASALLFGTRSSLTGYDLSAPSAPKPRSSGNPFA